MCRVYARFNQSLEDIKSKKVFVSHARSGRYFQLHHVSSDIIKKRFSVTILSVNKQNLQDLKSEYEKDQRPKSMFNQPKNLYKKKENKLYWNDKLCLPERGTKKFCETVTNWIWELTRTVKITLQRVERYCFG